MFTHIFHVPQVLRGKKALVQEVMYCAEDFFFFEKFKKKTNKQTKSRQVFRGSVGLRQTIFFMPYFLNAFIYT